jgi:hypothetical protein
MTIQKENAYENEYVIAPQRLTSLSIKGRSIFPCSHPSPPGNIFSSYSWIAFTNEQLLRAAANVAFYSLIHQLGHGPSLPSILPFFIDSSVGNLITSSSRQHCLLFINSLMGNCLISRSTSSFIPRLTSLSVSLRVVRTLMSFPLSH